MTISNIVRMCLVPLLVFGVSYSFSQSLILREMDKSVRLPLDSLSFVKVKDIQAADRDGLIDPRFLMFGDTVETFFFHRDYWFRLKSASQKWDEKRAVELFAYSDSSRQLWQITHHDLFWSSAYGGSVEHLYLHADRLIAVSACHENDPVGHVRLLVVDTHNHKVALALCLRNAGWLENMYSVGDSLHVILAPMRREENPDYAGSWWMPRGRPSKWDYSRDGFSWHFVLDKDFVVVRSEEMEKNATDFDKNWRLGR